jgi:hypothetical protein
MGTYIAYPVTHPDPSLAGYHSQAVAVVAEGLQWVVLKKPVLSPGHARQTTDAHPRVSAEHSAAKSKGLRTKAPKHHRWAWLH